MDGITPLVVLLDGHKEQAHHAANALALLAENSSESCKKIAESGGIGPLSGLLQEETSKTEKIFGIRALGEIALTDEATRNKIVQHNVVSRLFEFHRIEDMKSHAMYALSTIATDLKSWKKIDSKQVIEAMIDLLWSQVADDEIKEYAAAVLKPLCFSEHKASVLYAIQPLVHLLWNGTDGQKTNASAVLANLSRNQAHHRKIVDSEALGPLAKLLTSRSDDQKDNALSALVDIVTKPSDTAFANRIFYGFTGTNIVASLRDLIYDGTEQQVVKVVRVLKGLLENYNCYQEISTGAPGTYRALVYLQNDGTARQKALATGVIISFETIKTEKWDAVEYEVNGVYPAECRSNEDNEIEQKRTNLGPF